jgi:tetratricopeptide (TPR) repeat protein
LANLGRHLPAQPRNEMLAPRAAALRGGSVARRTASTTTTTTTSSRPALSVSASSIPRLASLRAQAKTSSSSQSPSTPPAPTTARQAVEQGLDAFRGGKGDPERAAALFAAALDLRPNSEEAAAALYNQACALAKLRRWQQASDALERAVNEHGLKLSVAASDPDFADFRDTREWIDLLQRVRGGLSREAKINLRTEARAPFRLARTILFGGLSAGAGLGLIVILGRLAASLKGGEGAPPLAESLTNLAVNAGALTVLAFLLLRDLAGRERDLRVTQREEGLGRLLIDLGGGRVLPLIRFRGVIRPLIVAGDRPYVERQLREAEPRIEQLRARGVSVVPVVYAADPDERLRALRREFQQQDNASAGKKGFVGAGGKKQQQQEGSGDGGEAPAAATNSGQQQQEDAPSPIRDSDKKWRLEPSALPEWEQWVLEQRDFAGLSTEGEASRNVWVQVALDGTVRGSDRGTVPWARLVNDLPPLDNIRTLITDGVGTSV